MKWRIALIGFISLLTVAGVWAGLDFYERSERRAVVEGVEQATTNLTIAFEESVQAILSNSDWALRRLGAVYLANIEDGGDGVSALSREVLPPFAFQLSFVDAAGMLRYSNLSSNTTPVYLGDREHFRVHLNPDFTGLFISRPVYGRVSGVWSVQLSLKVIRPDGSMAGVLVMSVDRRKFTDFFDRIDIGQRGMIALIGMDHWLRARASNMMPAEDPYATPLYDRPFFEPGAPDAGIYRITARYDLEERIGGYRKVRGFPLVVVALYSYPEALAAHEAKIDRLRELGSVASAVIVVFAVFVVFLLEKRDQARRTAADSEARWRLALEAVGDGVWDWRPKDGVGPGTDVIGGSVNYSRTWGRMLGFAAAELSYDVKAWHARVHPDDVAAVDVALSQHMRGRTSLYVCEYRLRRKDGSYIWVLDRGVAVERLPSGEPSRVVGISSDITERRRLEEELTQRNQEMQQLQAAFTERQLALSRQRLSEAQRVARLGAMEPEEDEPGHWRLCAHAQTLLGVQGHDVVDLEDAFINAQGEDRAALLRAFTGFPAQRLDIEFQIQVGGETRYIHAVGGGNPGNGAFVMLQDVTAHRDAEKERALIRARVEENSRMEALGTLAAGIAHEINTPAQFVGDNLAFLRTSADSLLDVARAAKTAVDAGTCPEPVAERLAAADYEFLEQEVPAAIVQAQSGMERISAIVRAVKEFCYPSAKEPTPFDLNHMVESAVTVTRNSWKYVAELTTDLDPALPELVAIEGEINQVLVNLIVNAAQAIGEQQRPEPGRITVSTRSTVAEIVLSIADDGVGIPPEKHKKIFELFYTTKPPGTGTGQGLAVSAAIVRRHGGRINVISAPGQGAQFDVWLPRKPGVATENIEGAVA